MAYKSLRDWLARLEEEGQVKHITTEVDWNLELGAIVRRVSDQKGPALLFENIKDYKNTACRKFVALTMGTRGRTAMALGLPKDVSYRGITEALREGFKKRIEPVIVSSGPVKENIMKGDAVNLYEIPVPKYFYMDGGRYISTHSATVTMDPDTKLMNIGMYRGMIGDDEKSIPVLMARSKHWGIHFSRYEQRGEDMPVAVAYGLDPALKICAGVPLGHHGYSEYEIVGGLRGAPVELVKCETNDIYVPASAEIVVEGRISTDPATFQMEGPYGEYTGFFGGMARPRQTIHVDCITHCNDPIFQGCPEGITPGHLYGHVNWLVPGTCAAIWNNLESIGVPNVLGVWSNPVTNGTNLRIQIDTIYRGHAKQVAAAIFSSPMCKDYGKNVIVVDKDIDVFDDEAVEWALAYRTNAAMGDFQFFEGTIGSMLDPSIPLADRDNVKYGQGKWTRVLTDATVNWDLEPEEQYGGRREPPLCTQLPPEVDQLITKRWQEYGF